MPKKALSPLSAIPDGKEKSAHKELRVDLLGMIRLLLDYLTPALCESVFNQCRNTERERKWTFYAVNLFWAAMIIRHPSAIQQGLDQTRKGRGRDKLWPRVMASARAFFKKADGLRPHLFQTLYQAFTVRILPKAQPVYASWMKGLLKRFPDVLAVDGSRLDAVNHNLGILRHVRAQVLPGCLTVFYDIFRGISRQVLFYPDAAEAELPRAQEALNWIVKGTLLLGDRLYASVQYFHLLASLELYGLFRKNGRLKIRRLEVLSRKQGSRSFLEDVLVEVGCGQRHPKITLRLIRYRSPGRKLDLLLSVLDPGKLSAEEAVSLYGLRWTIERMFLDLKETIDLHTLYSSHPSLVAQQIYAAAMVHTAFRIAQAGIARKAKVLPEQLSPAKLFPKLAQAANDYCVAQQIVLKTRELNPGVKIRFPSWQSLSTAYTRLEYLLARHRNGRRRKKRFCVSGRRWKSFAHVPGGPSLLKSLTVD
jgi:hypothetical protein